MNKRKNRDKFGSNKKGKGELRATIGWIPGKEGSEIRLMTSLGPCEILTPLSWEVRNPSSFEVNVDLATDFADEVIRSQAPCVAIVVISASSYCFDSLTKRKMIWIKEQIGFIYLFYFVENKTLLPIQKVMVNITDRIVEVYVNSGSCPITTGSNKTQKKLDPSHEHKSKGFIFHFLDSWMHKSNETQVVT